MGQKHTGTREDPYNQASCGSGPTSLPHTVSYNSSQTSFTSPLSSFIGFPGWLSFQDGSLSQSLLRKRLATILKLMDLPLLGFGFHTFCRSGATLAFDSNIPLHNIKKHGVWNSDAVWSYISDNTSLQVPLLFQHLANSLQ